MDAKYYIRRPIEGISLNGFEFVSEIGSCEPILFESEDAAKQYLLNAGYDADELERDLDSGAIDIDVWCENTN